MPIKKEIQTAIAMHSMWKARLDKCIETGEFDTPLHIVEQDDQCHLGKWLYGENIPSAARTSEAYQKVRDSHAKFHQVAAKVVELALAGNKQEAYRLMSSNGEYTKATTDLVSKMMDWANSIE